MKLREIMTTPCQAIDSSAGMQDAARKMKEANVGMLPVMNGDQCVGVLTDRDLVVRGLSEGTAGRTVKELMTPNPVCLDQECEVQEAMQLMESKEVGRLLVTDGGGKPIGVVSAGAISIAMKGDPKVGVLASGLSAAHSNSTN